MFGAGTITLSFFEITYFFHCGSDPNKGSSIQNQKYAIHFIFFLLILFFTFGQIFFLIFVNILRKCCPSVWKNFFSRAERRSGDTQVKLLLVKFFLVHLLATNMVLSIFFVAKESGLFLGGSGKSHDDIENLTCFGTNDTQPYAELHDRENILEPFVIEFILIVAGLLYSILRHLGHADSKDKIRSKIMDLCDQANLNRVLTANSTGKSAKRCQVITTCVLIFFGILLVFAMFVNAYYLKGRDNYSAVLEADYSLQIAVYFTEIVASCIVLAPLSSHKQSPRKLETDDKLLMFSMILGIIPSDLFALIAAIAGTGEKEIIVDGIPRFKAFTPSVLLLVFYVINIVSVCSITSAIIVTQRHKCKTTMLLQAMVFLLFCTNLGQWVLDAFIEFKDDATMTYSIVQQFYHDFPWQVINRSIYPLCIFYRFHAATMFMSIFLKFLDCRNSEVFVKETSNTDGSKRKRSKTFPA